MHQRKFMHVIIVVFAFVIMKVVTIPIRIEEYDAVNNTMQLSKTALTLHGTDLSQIGSKVTLSGKLKTNGYTLDADTVDIDFEFEDPGDSNKSGTTPEYMLELYNNFSRNTPFLHNSNIIRSFTHVPQRNDSTHFFNSIHVFACFGCRIHSLHFDISTISRTESINLAELRLYTLIKRDQNSFLGVSRLVKIYEVLNFTDRYGNRKYNHITSKYIQKLENAWESFDVTPALKRSIQTGSKTEHLEVRIQSMFTAQGEDNMDINADPNHIKQPILVVYSNDNPEHERRNDHHEVIMHELASKKHASHNYYTQLTDYSGINHNYRPKDMILSRTKRSKGHSRNSGCRRRPMYVNFADIDYDTWIIAPRGYQAYQCAGRCWFPISENLSPSNHAVIQTLMHMNHNRRAGRACCVPTELDPISLLYVDQNGVVTYKYMFDGMVVAKCGCR